MPEPELPFVLQILQEACAKYGYEFETLDTYSKQLIEISQEGKSCLTGTGKIPIYPLNLGTPTQIANDKAHTYTLLKSKGLSIPKGDYFFLQEEYRELRGDGKERENAFSFAKEIGYPVFVKPNRGSFGNLAEVVHNNEELKNHLDCIAERYRISLIQEVLKGSEYRIFVVDGEIEYAYKRSAPQIIGNGKDTADKLIQKHNEQYDLSERRMIGEDSLFLQNELKRHSLSFDAIVPNELAIQIAPNANIAVGSTISDYREEFSEECQKWCRRVAEVTNLRVCGIDIFSTTNLENSEDFTILEINRSPSLKGIYQAGHEEKVLLIWKKILEKYFVDTKG